MDVANKLLPKWIKYGIIMVYSKVSNKTFVDMFGCTYIVYGNVVAKIRGK